MNITHNEDKKEAGDNGQQCADIITTNDESEAPHVKGGTQHPKAYGQTPNSSFMA